MTTFEPDCLCVDCEAEVVFARRESIPCDKHDLLACEICTEADLLE